MSDFFNKDLSHAYDEKNRRLAPIADNMHFLIRLVLENLPDNARILCVGVGTGAEVLSLAEHYPTWSFVGVDPSAAMLEVCQQRLKSASIIDRCQLIHGYVQDAPKGANFDAALSVLVGHFVPREERADFYQNMLRRLRSGGYFVNTEISFDLDSNAFPSMLENWARIQKLMGATPESIQSLPTVLRDTLSVLAPDEIEGLFEASGISVPVRFFQSFMISGWYGKKE